MNDYLMMWAYLRHINPLDLLTYQLNIRPIVNHGKNANKVVLYWRGADGIGLV